jgi:cytochrome c-type biogenesis protein CcmF
VLTSVHAFASDPRRGVFILLILVLFIGGALALFAWRASTLTAGGLFAPVSREGALVLNNLLLTTCCATVFVGTLYPLALEALTGEKISVGAPFYNLTFGPLFVPLFLIMPVGQMLAWKRGDLLGAAQRLTVAAGVGCAVAVGMAAWRGAPVFSIVGTGLAAYLVIGAFVEVAGRVVSRGASASVSLARAFGLPRSAWGTAFAHAGLGVTLFGLAATGWGVERITTVKPGDTIDLGPYQLAVERIAPARGPNFSATTAHTIIRSGGVAVASIDPSRRFYATRQMTTTEAGIATLGLGQVYMTLAEQNPDGSFDARLYWKPYVALIWLGALVMAFGGALSLSDRRLRIGLAQRARRRVQPPAAAQPVE